MHVLLDWNIYCEQAIRSNFRDVEEKDRLAAEEKDRFNATEHTREWRQADQLLCNDTVKGRIHGLRERQPI